MFHFKSHSKFRETGSWGRRIVFLFAALLLIFLQFIILDRLFPLPSDVEYSTVIYDRKGNIMHAFLTSTDKWRVKTELNEISPLLQKAILEKEDKYFYHHPGINGVALIRAVINNVTSGRRTSGASTITMQVARALEPRERTYVSKLIEMFRSLQLELRYSKKEILQLYLNLVPYGGNIEGVKSASLLYFQKAPDHLSLAEILSLSVIPNRPSSLVMGKTNDRIVKERNKWLERFKSRHVFDETVINDALHEPLNATRGSFPRLAPHLSQKLRKSGNAAIHSTIDLNVQLKTEKLVNDYVRSLRLMGIYNAAAIILDNKTSEVIAYVGSADFSDTLDGGQVNGAAAVRQPGSTLKPLLYGLCIDEGLMTPKTRIADVAFNYRGYAPENYDKKLNGNVSMEYALDHSLNIPAVKSLQQLGISRFIDELIDCEFRQVARDQRKLGLSMILGGCGSSLEELTGLFSVFANQGIYNRPVYTTGDTRAKTRRVRILSEASSYMISEVLSKVNRPDFPLSWGSTEKMPKIAWKTGTSYGRRDAWSIGFNDRYTIGVWTGNFSGKGNAAISGAEIATPLLFRIFNTVDYDRENEWFARPKDVDDRIVCNESGLPPGTHCTDLSTDHFIPLISSSSTCSHIREVFISADESVSFCKTCLPESGYKKKLYRWQSSELEAWMAQHQIVHTKVPSHNPDCEVVFREGAPLITSPGHSAEYYIEKSNPEPIQLSCNAGSDVMKVYWYINDQFYRSAPASGKIFFVPTEGPVKISCADDKGRNRDVWIRVKYI